MKILKTIVFLMSGLIIAGIILLVYGLTHKNAPHFSLLTHNHEPLKISFADDGQILQITPLDNNRMVIWIRDRNQDQIIIIDSQNGQIISRFIVHHPTP